MPPLIITIKPQSSKTRSPKLQVQSNTSGQGNEDSPVTLFVVDDSELFQYYLKGYLRNHYAQKDIGQRKGANQGPVANRVSVFQYLNGQDAINNLWRKPDIILLDYYLDSDVDGQSRNGDWAYQQIKALLPTVKIVMLSNANEPEIIVQMVKLGLRDFVVKDVNHLQDLGQYLSKD